MSDLTLAEALLAAARRDPSGPRDATVMRASSAPALEAMRAGQVIVPETSDGPASVPVMGRRRLTWVFSDSEAYGSWVARQAPEMTCGLMPVTRSGDRRQMARMLRGCAADLVAVNPAGPGALLWPSDYVCSRASTLATGRRPAPPEDLALADPAGRGPARAAIAAAVSAGRAALAAGDRAGVDAAVASGRRLNEPMGDLYTEAVFDELVLRARLDDSSAGMTRAVLKTANAWSHIGQVPECAALLALGGRRAATALAAGDPDQWLRQAVGLVAAQLALLDLPGYRADADAALAWARAYPPAPR